METYGYYGTMKVGDIKPLRHFMVNKLFSVFDTTLIKKIWRFNAFLCKLWISPLVKMQTEYSYAWVNFYQLQKTQRTLQNPMDSNNLTVPSRWRINIRQNNQISIYVSKPSKLLICEKFNINAMKDLLFLKFFNID